MQVDKLTRDTHSRKKKIMNNHNILTHTLVKTNNGKTQHLNTNSQTLYILKSRLRQAYWR